MTVVVDFGWCGCLLGFFVGCEGCCFVVCGGLVTVGLRDVGWLI